MGRSCLYITPDRVLYIGLLGRPHTRVFGAAALYAVREGLLRLHAEGAPPDAAAHTGSVFWVPPHVPHDIRVEGGGDEVLCLLIEPEFSVLSGWPQVAQALAASATTSPWANRVPALWRRCLDDTPSAASPIASDADLDAALLGAPLPTRAMDPRVAAIVRHIQAHPSGALSANEAAAQCGLSASRFMHLFKQEVGTGFRALRSWKRARGLLPHVVQGDNLTHLAQTLGYPDASHFSHTVRQVSGLRPRDIVAGSRELRLLHPPGVCPKPAS